jgi:hypothetical protein
MKKGVSGVLSLMQFKHLMEYFRIMPDESTAYFLNKGSILANML